MAIEDVRRFNKTSADRASLSKVFTEREIGYCIRLPLAAEHFAARLAGKKAVIRALGGTDARLTEVEILNRRDGSPFVKIRGRRRRGFFISLSHSQKRAIAFFAVKERI